MTLGGRETELPEMTGGALGGAGDAVRKIMRSSTVLGRIGVIS